MSQTNKVVTSLNISGSPIIQNNTRMAAIVNSMLYGYHFRNIKSFENISWNHTTNNATP